MKLKWKMYSKDYIQKETVELIKERGGNGIIEYATGVGKSKIVIDYIKEVSPFPVLWVVPSTKLRDITVPAEFKKWDADLIFNNHVKTICYKSAHKIKHQHYGLIVLDEGHNITERSFELFKNNKYDKLLLLTATFPSDFIKQNLLKTLNLRTIAKLKVETAVNMKLISDYKVFVVECQLEGREISDYRNIDSYIDRLKENNLPVNKQLYFRRASIIYNSSQKTRAVKKIMDNLSEDKRVIIFSGSIDQAKKLSPYQYHSKTNDEHYKEFNEKRINTLAVVNAINEGDNLTDIDIAIMQQVNSKELRYIQRQGRALRFKEDHHAEIYITVIKDTVDEEWVSNSLASLNNNKIFKISMNSL